MLTSTLDPGALSEALGYLETLMADKLGPSEAKQRLVSLRSTFAGFRLRLLWQREAFDNTLQYDLLMTRSGEGTVSLAFCPEGSLPWPLRGGYRAREQVLVSVNGVEMDIAQAVACLDFIWDDTRLADRLITACLLRQELEEEPVELGDGEDLQGAMDAFRRSRGLLTTAETSEWLTCHSLTHRDLEDLVAGEEAVVRLRARSTRGQVEPYFQENRRGFDMACLARLVFPTKLEAERFMSAGFGAGEFYAYAEEQFTRGQRKESQGLLTRVRRDALPAQVADHVFAASTGDILGPFGDAEGFAVVKVLSVKKAALDEETRDLIERSLFGQWLTRRKESARIQWFWGNVARAPSQGV